MAKQVYYKFFNINDWDDEKRLVGPYSGKIWTYGHGRTGKWSAIRKRLEMCVTGWHAWNSLEKGMTEAKARSSERYGTTVLFRIAYKGQKRAHTPKTKTVFQQIKLMEVVAVYKAGRNTGKKTF